MKVNLIRIILFIVITVFLLNIYTTNCVAADISNILFDGNGFLIDGKNNAKKDKVIDNEELKETSNMIFNILLLLGTFLSAIVGGIIGIKFMLASAEDKAKIKESMMPYVLGCVVIFGAAGIWKLCITVFAKL